MMYNYGMRGLFRRVKMKTWRDPVLAHHHENKSTMIVTMPRTESMCAWSEYIAGSRWGNCQTNFDADQCDDNLF